MLSVYAFCIHIVLFTISCTILTHNWKKAINWPNSITVALQENCLFRCMVLSTTTNPITSKPHHAFVFKICHHTYSHYLCQGCETEGRKTLADEPSDQWRLTSLAVIARQTGCLNESDSPSLDRWVSEDWEAETWKTFKICRPSLCLKHPPQSHWSAANLTATHLSQGKGRKKGIRLGLPNKLADLWLSIDFHITKPYWLMTYFLSYYRLQGTQSACLISQRKLQPNKSASQPTLDSRMLHWETNTLIIGGGFGDPDFDCQSKLSRNRRQCHFSKPSSCYGQGGIRRHRGRRKRPGNMLFCLRRALMVSVSVPCWACPGSAGPAQPSQRWWNSQQKEK